MSCCVASSQWDRTTTNCLILIYLLYRYEQLRNPDAPSKENGGSSTRIDVRERSMDSMDSVASTSSRDGGGLATQKSSMKGSMKKPFNMQFGTELTASPSSQEQLSWASVSATLVCCV